MRSRITSSHIHFINKQFLDLELLPLQLKDLKTKTGSLVQVSTMLEGKLLSIDLKGQDRKLIIL